jgi:NADP-dependent 3-hydroxy acid dehydrogenase YdfG
VAAAQNAGLALGIEMAPSCSLDDWDAMVDTNVKGLLYVTRAILPGMVARNRGCVLAPRSRTLAAAAGNGS